MDLSSPKTIREILEKYQSRPSKGLGQNFLIDKNILKKIIDSAEISKSDTILEVGPGLGVLTTALAEKAGKIIAVEKDETMIEILKETAKDFKNIEVINGDILEQDFKLEKYKLVANIPYYLTSPLIRKFLESENQPEFLVLMMQKEVAQRICAKPKKMSLLAASVQFYAEPKIVSYVSKNCFWPAPKIDSAIIKITPCSDFTKKIDPDLFFEVVKAGFSHPRKQLVNNLSGLKVSNDVKLTKAQILNLLSQANIDSNRRAETLEISDWMNLAKYFKTLKA